MNRRSGTTLVEVLVAIFVMGIGMIALLTLFPLGVLRMAQAINDERAAQAAVNADKNALIYNIRNDGTGANPGVVTDGVTPDFFANPLNGTLKAADPYGESYTLFVDPIGFNSGATSPWVGSVTGLLRRRPVSFAANQASVAQSFTLWDDITFNSIYDPTTLPATLPGTPELAGVSVMRNTRFSWGYTMRRPMTAEKSVVDCSIVVFDSRSLSLGSNLGLGEHVYNPPSVAANGAITNNGNAFFNPNNNTVVVYFDPVQNNPPPPPVRPGNWIMDATMYTTTNAAGTVVGSQHNYWYRVLATQDVSQGGLNYAVFEIQGQIRGFNNFPTVGTDPTTSQSAYPGTVVILEGVAEVFEKGPARTP